MLWYPSVHHIGIVVADMDGADRYVREKLGLAGLVRRTRLDLTGVLYLGQEVSYSAEFAFAVHEGSELEFIQPIGDTISPYRVALDERGEHMHHLAYMVPSVTERLNAAQQAGADVEILLDASLPGGVGRFVYANGLLPGVLVELIEITDPATRGAMSDGRI